MRVCRHTDGMDARNPRRARPGIDSAGCKAGPRLSQGAAFCVTATLWLLWPAPPAAQDRATPQARDAATWLAVRPDDSDFTCGTPELVARWTRSRLPTPRLARMAATEDESSYGQPLWFDPQPRLIRADGTEGLAFEDFLIGGDIDIVYFRRWSRDAGEVITETWRRTGTRTLQGRLVSVFNPTWAEWELWDTFIGRRRGFDKPLVDFGTIRIPSNGDPEDDDFEEMRIRLPVAPLNLPESRVQTIGDSVQYASHVVNMVVPEFGNGRVEGNDSGFELEEVTKAFYGFFPDVYDSIAVVTAEQHPSSRFQAYHWNVRNPIEGLANWGTFDYTDRYGSRGALRSVEVYRDAGFTPAWLSNHEIGHQWADYWHWSKLAGFPQLAGWEPRRHTPLLSPGEVLLGSVLLPSRRVALADDGEETSYVIENTPAPSRYHPTTLYRMGLIGPNEVPEMVVFENQGQFSADSRSAPAIGAAVEGGARAVHINDILAEHGVRSGPVDSSWRRVTIVVSRYELLSPEEMNYWNFFAARHEARSGATTFGGMPPFYEATGDRATLDTTVERSGESRIVNDPPLQVSDVPIDPGEFRGVELDEEIPGSMTVGETMAFTGTITVAQAADIVEVCVEQWHAGGPPDEDGDEFSTSTTCGEPAGNRFDIPLRFEEAGRYGLAVLLKDRTDDVTEPAVTRLSMISGITVP